MVLFRIVNKERINTAIAREKQMNHKKKVKFDINTTIAL